MLKKGLIIILVSMIYSPLIFSAPIPPGIAAEAPQAARVESAAARVESAAAQTQVQATTRTKAIRSQNLPINPKQEVQSHPFQAAGYLGFSIGPRLFYNHWPAFYRGIATILSGGVATMLTPHWYFAGEVFVDHSFKTGNHSNLMPRHIQPSWTYGLDFIPGFMITQYVLGYFRAGVQNTYFNSISSGVMGWRVGLGAETNIYKNWDLRGEYVFSRYTKSSLAYPIANQYNLGVLYKFL